MLRLVGRGGGVAHHVRALATFGPPSVNGPSQKVKFKAPHKRYDERVSISHPVTNHRLRSLLNHPTNTRAPPPNPPLEQGRTHHRVAEPGAGGPELGAENVSSFPSRGCRRGVGTLLNEPRGDDVHRALVGPSCFPQPRGVPSARACPQPHIPSDACLSYPP